MLTFRSTVSGSLVVSLALSSLLLYIPGAQSLLLATSASGTAGCSLYVIQVLSPAYPNRPHFEPLSATLSPAPALVGQVPPITH
jgi:hypothetical protein